MSDNWTRTVERRAEQGDPAAGHAAIAALIRRGAPLVDYMAHLPGYAPEGMDPEGREGGEGGPFHRGYVGWSPGGDYMPGPGQGGESQHGWRAGIEHATWAEARELLVGDTDLNLVVDYYFSVSHNTTECPPCKGSGLSAAGERERRAKAANDHSHDWYKAAKERHGDAIHCPGCNGDGSIRTGPDRLELRLWLLHPRKGASRGVEVKSVRPEELEGVRTVLRDHWQRLQRIWSWVRT